jgi:hypothetical protein
MIRHVIFAILIWVSGGYLSAQADSLAFPAAWQGHWVGDLVISTVQGEAQRVPMSLRIEALPDGRYTYTIVYGADTPENTRPYYLQAVPDSPGHFETDEGNGILLDDYFINGKLYARFEVMGNLLLSTLEQQGEHLVYEIISGPMAPTRTTGNTVVDGEEIPPVNGYKITVQQRARLVRQ